MRIEDRGITAWLAGTRFAEKLGKPQMVSPQVWKDQVFAGVAQTLHSIAIQEPIILFIEDIHWADSASLALLHYVARSVNNSERILILATFRSEELTADAEGHPHPLAETLRTMEREDLYTEIKLSNLDQTNVSKMAENMIGGSLQAEFAQKLAAESRGNPLFVVESLRMLNERKSLVEENNEWRLAADELGLPSKIKGIILRRLAILKNPQRRVLDAASVIGEEFDVELLSSVLGQDSLEVLEILNVIANSTSLVTGEENCYRFDHARSREVLYNELSPLLKRGYHNRIGEKLESVNSSALPLSDLAYHYAKAGNDEKATRYALLAGQDALARFSNAEAIKHFSYVLQNTSEIAQAETRRKAEEGLGDAYYANSMFKDAIRTFEDLSKRQTGADKLRALRKAMEATFMFRDIKHLMELVKEAEPLAAADRLEYARVLVSRGRAYTFGSYNPKLALEDYVAAFRVFDEEYSLWDAALALLGFGNESLVGKLHEGLAATLRSIALFKELGDVHFQMEAMFGTGLIFRNCGLFDEALKLLSEIVEINEKMRTGDYARLFISSALSISMYAFKHNLETTLSHCLKALELSKQTDSLEAPAIAYSSLCIIYATVGDMTHAEEYFEKFMKQPPEIRNNTMVRSPIEAVFFAGKNQWKESNQRFKEMIKAAQNPGLKLLMKNLFAWALEKQGRSAEANTLREEAQKSFREIQEKVTHVWLQASLMVRREVSVGEQLETHIDIVNVSRSPCQLIRVETVVPAGGFQIAPLPVGFSLQEGGAEMQGRNINAFEVVTGKVTLKAIKTGTFALSLKAIYKDDMGETKTCKVDPITVTVKPAKLAFEVLPGRVATGTLDLDRLLLGIPERYAVALASPSTDERELLVSRFLKAGAEADQITLHITTEIANTKVLAEEYPSNFHLFLCNPNVDAMIQNLPNVYKLKGVENLTEIDIALAKAFRILKTAQETPRRICIEIVSDALLLHHAVNTRRWLSALLPTLKSKGFTILAVVDPSMHPAEELQAVLGVFDGEIRVTEKETPEGTKQVMKVRKLVSQKYSDKEVILDKEKLAA
jgi:predicted ATPase/KaiC/GvpD/RAD55 family RecA-like ATPase